MDKKCTPKPPSQSGGRPRSAKPLIQRNTETVAATASACRLAASITALLQVERWFSVSYSGASGSMPLAGTAAKRVPPPPGPLGGPGRGGA